MIKLEWSDSALYLFAFWPPGWFSLKRLLLSLFLHWPPCEIGKFKGGRWCREHGHLGLGSLCTKLRATHAELRCVWGGIRRWQDLEQNESVLLGVWISDAYKIMLDSESPAHESARGNGSACVGGELRGKAGGGSVRPRGTCPRAHLLTFEVNREQLHQG